MAMSRERADMMSHLAFLRNRKEQVEQERDRIQESLDQMDKDIEYFGKALEDLDVVEQPDRVQHEQQAQDFLDEHQAEHDEQTAVSEQAARQDAAENSAVFEGSNDESDNDDSDNSAS